MTSDSGQTLVELMVSFALVTVTVIGAGWVIQAQWNRSKCAYLVFQATREKLNGPTSVLQSLAHSSIHITDAGGDVTGEALCGEAQETVHLKKLQWPL